ncbi:MAG TPA: ATP synthase subunit I [Steroidobacteraceae bacterium]|nr:ATP synthase subunit I [Steroidobacteraceae bacterium]
MADAIDLPAARRLAFKVVLGQAGVTLIAALVGWLAAGRIAALSALLGGGIATVASFAMVAVAFRNSAPVSAARLLGRFFGGEALKLVVVVVLFVAVLRWLHPAPLALLITFGATFVVYWLALGLALPGKAPAPPLRGAQG